MGLRRCSRLETLPIAACCTCCLQPTRNLTGGSPSPTPLPTCAPRKPKDSKVGPKKTDWFEDEAKKEPLSMLVLYSCSVLIPSEVQPVACENYIIDVLTACPTCNARLQKVKSINKSSDDALLPAITRQPESKAPSCACAGQSAVTHVFPGNFNSCGSFDFILT